MFAIRMHSSHAPILAEFGMPACPLANSCQAARVKTVFFLGDMLKKLPQGPVALSGRHKRLVR
jgi:hypothetical protein